VGWLPQFRVSVRAVPCITAGVGDKTGHKASDGSSSAVTPPPPMGADVRAPGTKNGEVNHDTAAFAVESIRRWWHELGTARYPTATRLLINADCGGRNGARLRLWKRELQVLAGQLGLSITVCHPPPGTSKWNKIGVSRTHPRKWRCGTV
jgi:hypothetical protein